MSSKVKFRNPEFKPNAQITDQNGDVHQVMILAENNHLYTFMREDGRVTDALKEVLRPLPKLEKRYIVVRYYGNTWLPTEISSHIQKEAEQIAKKRYNVYQVIPVEVDMNSF